ncbi:uncharacterized protein LOC134257211 [Saccostrea cucullata]|uniref:uncharacterized protein LOC134257211 n=1 Tax=Saccostrea cuccullata TaxID=36930 RepID=UPI002ED54AA2
MGLGSSAQYKVRQCAKCQGDTEFFCNTCNHDLCFRCKERHVIELDTKQHYVVIYREKYDFLKQETCMRHQDRICKKYCYSCELPVCAKCEKYIQHETLDIRKAYKTIREQHRDILHRIRSETLYNSRFFLAQIKTDLKTAQTEIINHQMKMSTKAQRLKDLIDTVMCDIQVRNKKIMDLTIYGLRQQKRNIKRHLASIEKYEYCDKQSADRPVEFLYFLKNTFVPKIRANHYCAQYALLFLSAEINMEDVIKLLSKIQIIERGQRRVRNECFLELMSTPVLVRSVKLKTSGLITHISCLNSDRFWISQWHSCISDIILINTEGGALHHLTSIDNLSWKNIYGTQTVNKKGELIYLDFNNEVYKLSLGNTTKSALIKGTDTWDPRCVYSSILNGDLLVGMFSYFEQAGKINRYNNTGQHIQTIQHNTKGQQLYNVPYYITENRNGDVIVSNLGRLVVTNRKGRHRFFYTGPSTSSLLQPYGICTDALSHILVCDWITNTVQMIDKDGHFLSRILTRTQGIYRPNSLCYDIKTHLLWVGSWNDNTLCVYKYIKRKSCETDTRTTSTLIEATDLWKPRCVFSSPVNGDLLIILVRKFCFNRNKINRYDSTGQHIQTIRDNRIQQLYSNPIYIVENRNGDVIVFDYNWLRGAVVVRDRVGRHRFSYTGHQSGSRLQPRGICTDALSHIIVCDLKTLTIQKIDKDGHFLSTILTGHLGKIPHTLSYDNKTHLLWVGFWDSNKICAYRYFTKFGKNMLES